LWMQTFGLPPRQLPGSGFAGGGNRTPDLLITNQLLYRLSYAGVLSNQSLRIQAPPVSHNCSTFCERADVAAYTRRGCACGKVVILRTG
jgi:hypothetical protein